MFLMERLEIGIYLAVHFINELPALLAYPPLLHIQRYKSGDTEVSYLGVRIDQPAGLPQQTIEAIRLIMRHDLVPRVGSGVQTANKGGDGLLYDDISPLQRCCGGEFNQIPSSPQGRVVYMALRALHQK